MGATHEGIGVETGGGGARGHGSHKSILFRLFDPQT